MSVPEPVPALRGISSYAVPKPQAPTDLRLDGNEGAAPDPWILEQLARDGAEVIRCYPSAAAVQSAIADRFSLDANRIVVTAGADEALDRVCRAFLCEGRSILRPTPGFEMLDKYARLARASVGDYEWLGDFPRKAVADALTGFDAPTILAIVSPNNPTGLAISEEDFRFVAERASDSLVLVDLAYSEFADFDLTHVAAEYDNTILVRSLSKSWGIAGLRVGFAYAPTRFVDALRVAGSPYSVAGPALRLAELWLGRGGDDVAQAVRDCRRRRAELRDLLAGFGITVWPSQANFVLAKLPNAAEVHERIAASGIAVRAFPGRELVGDCLRITCPTSQADMQRLVRALEQVLGCVQDAGSGDGGAR